MFRHFFSFLLLLFFLFSVTDVASMVKEMGKKGISVKDEPGLSVVRLFGPGVGDEKVRVCVCVLHTSKIVPFKVPSHVRKLPVDSSVYRCVKKQASTDRKHMIVVQVETRVIVGKELERSGIWDCCCGTGTHRYLWDVVALWYIESHWHL